MLGAKLKWLGTAIALSYCMMQNEKTSGAAIAPYSLARRLLGYMERRQSAKVRIMRPERQSKN